MNRKAKVFGLLAVVLSATTLGCVLLFRHWEEERTAMLARCMGYEESVQGSILDCYGVISIISSNSTAASKYLIRDHEHNNRTLAAVDSFDQFIVADHQLYTLNKQPNSCYDNLRQKYCKAYYVNGELKVFDYNKVEDIPAYLIIDTTNGNVRFYKTATEAPQDAWVIFHELEDT